MVKLSQKCYQLQRAVVQIRLIYEVMLKDDSLLKLQLPVLHDDINNAGADIMI